MSFSIARTPCVVVGVLFASGAALAGIAAENSSTTFAGNNLIGLAPGGSSNTKYGQTFLAEESGKLQSILVRGFYHNITANTLQQPLRIDVFAVNAGNGLPFGPSLGGWDTPAADIPLDNWTNGYLFVHGGAPVDIVAGERYAFIMGVAIGASTPGGVPYTVAYTGNTYIGGSMVQWHQGLAPAAVLAADFSFEVTVPTPGAAAFLALAGLSTLRRRSR